MATNIAAGPASRVLALGFIAMLTAGAQASGRERVLELRVFAYATLDSAGLRTAREVSQVLFASAGIQTIWRDCGAAGESCADSQTGPFVRVHLLPLTRPSDPSTSGDAIPGDRPRIARVYMPRIKEIHHDIVRSSGGRSMPELATLETAHLVGIVIAHEVGHALGLHHSSEGVMKERLSATDIIAARRWRLLFQADEQQRMREALVGYATARQAGGAL